MTPRLGNRKSEMPRIRRARSVCHQQQPAWQSSEVLKVPSGVASCMRGDTLGTEEGMRAEGRPRSSPEPEGENPRGIDLESGRVARSRRD